MVVHVTPAMRLGTITHDGTEVFHCKRGFFYRGHYVLGDISSHLSALTPSGPWTHDIAHAHHHDNPSTWIGSTVHAYYIDALQVVADLQNCQPFYMYQLLPFPIHVGSMSRRHLHAMSSRQWPLMAPIVKCPSTLKPYPGRVSIVYI